MSSLWDSLPAGAWPTEPATLPTLLEHQVFGWPQYIAPRPLAAISPNANENKASGAAPPTPLFAQNPLVQAPTAWTQPGQTAIGDSWPLASSVRAPEFGLPSAQEENAPSSIYPHPSHAFDFFSLLLRQGN